MIKPILDNQFNYNRTEKYNISIQVGLDGFSFSIITPEKNKLLALYNSPLKISSPDFLGRRLSEWLTTQELLQKPYASTHILYYSNKFTPIPGEFYCYDHQEEITNLVFGKEKTSIIKDNYIPEIGCNLLFTIPVSLQETLNIKFPSHTLLHSVTPILSKGGNVSGANKLILYFTENNFCVVLYKGDNFICTNNFGYKHTNDILFYIFSLLKSNNIERNDIKLYISGDIYSDGEIYSSLSTYFRELSFLNPEIAYNFQTFREPLHRFFTLF